MFSLYKQSSEKITYYDNNSMKERQKMKILFVNMLLPQYIRGHNNLDNKMIEFFSKVGSLYVMMTESNGLKIPYDVITVKRKWDKEGNNVHSYALQVVKWVQQLDSREHFDFIIFESFDTVVMSLAYLIIRLSNKRIYVMHHNNIDNIELSKYAKMLFLMYCKNIHHITLDEFIGDHLEKHFCIHRSKILSLPHPMCGKTESSMRERRYDCVGISNSNDEEWIRKLVSKEKQTDWFTRHKKYAVFKSKTIQFDNGFLKVINGFIDEKEYEYYYGNAKRVFLPFPYDFRYRMSGSLIDALSNRSIVIGTKIPVIERYSEKYPTVCKYVEAIDELLEMIKIDDYKYDDYAFDLFFDEHSDMNIQEIILEEFKEGTK